MSCCVVCTLEVKLYINHSYKKHFEFHSEMSNLRPFTGTASHAKIFDVFVDNGLATNIIPTSG